MTNQQPQQPQTQQEKNSSFIQSITPQKPSFDNSQDNPLKGLK